MNQINVWVERFFDEMEISQDEHENHHYKDYIQFNIQRFLANENKENAFLVYKIFFECYGYKSRDTQIDFINLVERMREYEEKAALLTKKQRDHYIHSVNVFLLGLAIYASNKDFREAFWRRDYKDEIYRGQRDSVTEEFFFRWGLAALCHDIGYPIEIITNQVNDFMTFTTFLRENDRKVISRVEFDRFDIVNSIPEHMRKRDFTLDFYEKNENCVYIDLLKPVDLLAHDLNLKLGVDLNKVKEKLDSYVADSGRSGRIDHGFFSALIMLKWFGYLIQISNCSPDILYYPVLDSASAVLLHNFYAIALIKGNPQNTGFALGPLKMQQHPIAYLLMLCDELQEWNREPYGELDKKRTNIQSVVITLDEERLDITYLVEKGAMSEEFNGAKYGLLHGLLDLAGLFPAGISVGNESVAVLQRSQTANASVPTLILSELEKLAIAIHDRYNRTSLRLHPEKPIDYPNFSTLPIEKKEYNLRAAREWPQMLAKVGCEIRERGYPGEKIEKFTPEEIEILAACEHDRWMRSRQEFGWRYGPLRDDEQRFTPFMIDYADLTEEVKEYDRDPARDIPALLESIGLAVFRKSETPVNYFSEEETEQMARRIHDYYNELKLRTEPDAVIVSFDELSEEKRNSNRRQARGIPNKLSHIGCILLPKNTQDHGEKITSFSPDVIEMLAKVEHDEWMGEKLDNGWRFAPHRDEEKKLNAYMVPFDQLSEQIKEYDRDAIRNMPRLADQCGYAIFKER